jgi:hypothetical protein
MKNTSIDSLSFYLAKPVKLNSAVLCRLEQIRDRNESYSNSINKLIDLAEGYAATLGIVKP